MADETRKPKFAFMPTPWAYGKLDLQYELIECGVLNGRLVERHYPKSWEEAVIEVARAQAQQRYAERRPLLEEWQRLLPEREKEYATQYEARKQDPTLPKPARVPDAPYMPTIPEKLVLVGLNDLRDCYEIVFDPHDIGGEVDPMMLLNFRRKI